MTFFPGYGNMWRWEFNFGVVCQLSGLVFPLVLVSAGILQYEAEGRTGGSGERTPMGA